MLIEVYEGQYVNTQQIVKMSTSKESNGKIRVSIETVLTNATKQSVILALFDDEAEFNEFLEKINK